MPARHLLAFLLALTFTFASPAVALPITDPQAIEKELMDLRSAMADAMKAKDAAKLREMFADGFSHIDDAGKFANRDAHITALLIRESVIEDAGVAEWRVQVVGPNVAILTGRSTLTLKASSRSYAVRWTQVFVRENGIWRVAASQVTPLP
jgi:ketosteroid isomerase-like protein